MARETLGTAEGEEIPGIGEVPEKIVMGEGILEAMEDMGLGQNGPDFIHAHEFAHHVQFELGIFEPFDPTDPDQAERTRYTELMADGFYFNEVSNEASSARLVLYALSDITDKSTLNVNLMSHMEKDRIYSLLDDGADFSDAKAQAQQEILDMFGIEKADMAASELLDIAGEGDDHAILRLLSSKGNWCGEGLCL